MTKIQATQLSDSLPEILAQVKQGEVFIVEDKNGQFQCSITPYKEASAQEQK